MFDKILGTWKKDPVDLKSKEDAKLMCSRPYLVLKVYEEISKKEYERLVLLEFLEITNKPEWGSQSYAQPKRKTN